MHDKPWTIKLIGRELWMAFVKRGPISTELFDAITRLLQEEDATMYRDSGCQERQWRHLIPPCFGVQLLHQSLAFAYKPAIPILI